MCSKLLLFQMFSSLIMRTTICLLIRAKIITIKYIINPIYLQDILIRLPIMSINYKKIKCPHCGKKFLATFGTSNYCPSCQAPTTIELGDNFKCKSCHHKFRVPKKAAYKCPKCGSRKIKMLIPDEYDIFFFLGAA